MAFLTILKHSNFPNRGNNLLRIFSCGRFFLIKHFYLDFDKLRKSQCSLSLHSPLFQLLIGHFKIPFAGTPSPHERRLRASGNIGLLSINSPLTKRAHSSSLVNKNREMIFRIVNEMMPDLRERNLVSIYLTPASVFASPQEIEKHLRQSLCKYLKVPVEEEGSRVGEVFECLRCFNMDQWSNSSIKALLQRKYPTSTPMTYNLYTCHFYRLHSAKLPKEIIMDLQDFRSMLAKFDFFAFFGGLRVGDEKKRRTLSRRLPRVLRWRSCESEEYLVFLVNQFGHERMNEALEVFELVAQEYTKRIGNSR